MLMHAGQPVELFIGGFREPRLCSRIFPRTEVATCPDWLPTPVFTCLDEAVDPLVALVHGPVKQLFIRLHNVGKAALELDVDLAQWLRKRSSAAKTITT